MGTIPTPIIHQPRLNPVLKDSEIAISADAFGIINGSWSNTENIYGGGGFLTGTYRLGENLSPLFISGSFGGFAGKTNFTCDKKSDCSAAYLLWLADKNEQDDYSFWSLQEQITLGAEFNIPINLFLGVGAGTRLFQSSGDFDNKRDQLDNLPGINSEDNGKGISPAFSFWIGYHIGQGGKYGSIMAELDWTRDFVNDNAIYIPTTISYFHPSGFHGGVLFSGTSGVNIFVGKTFTF